MPAPTGAQGDAGQQGNGTPPAAAGSGAAAGEGNNQPAAGDSGAHDTQRAIDAIVARERKRADAEIERIRTDYDRRIGELEARVPKPEGDKGNQGKSTDDAIAAARKPLEDAVATEKAARGKLEKTLISTMVEAAAKDTTAPKVAAMLADGQVRLKADGTAEVVDANGQPRYTAKGPMTVAELVAEIASANDFLIPAAMRKGGNYQGAQQQGQQTTAERIAALEAEGKFAEANALKAQQLWAMPKPAAAAPAGQ